MRAATCLDESSLDFSLSKGIRLSLVSNYASTAIFSSWLINRFSLATKSVFQAKIGSGCWPCWWGHFRHVAVADTLQVVRQEAHFRLVGPPVPPTTRVAATFDVFEAWRLVDVLVDTDDDVCRRRRRRRRLAQIFCQKMHRSKCRLRFVAFGANPDVCESQKDCPKN